MKKILGLDLGTNSIGWSLIEQNFENKTGKILGMGSRIIPMDAGEMGKFAGGAPIETGTSARTTYRSARKLYERNHLRRERLHRVLNVLGFLPEHYANDIDFEKRFGKFKDETETKLVWKKNGKKENGKDKFEFVFQSTFKEMLEEFKKPQPDLLNRKNIKGEDVKIPYDWTIYYLRKKALTDKITKEELAWLILNFNQKRGYYQLRGEDEENNTNINEYVIPLKITKVEKGEVDKKNDKKTWYTFTLSNGWTYSATFTTEPKWLDIEKDFLVMEELDENGNIKIVKDKKSDTTGKEKRRITPLPSFEEIDLMAKKDQDKIYKKIKARTEITIENSKQTVGTYIYETLLKNPTQKIRGKLVRTIERKFYKEELKAILEKQIALQPELFTDELYNTCVRELYKSNEAHQLQLSKRDFVHLFLDDIIFYQRPLRSQKSSIGNCSLEFRLHKINKKDDKGTPIKNQFEQDENGKEIEVKEYLKVIPKSNPYYQEFRIWQWLYNLKIYTKKDDNDVTATFLNATQDWEKLFEFLMSKKEVDHKDILKYFFKDLKGKVQTTEIAKYRWNYVYDSEKDESKTYPMNETGSEIRRLLKKANIADDFLIPETEQQLWHIIYSVTDKNEFEKALKSFAAKHKLDKTSFVENFKNFKPFKSEYGSFSEKAIKKLLPLIRLGNYWKWENIDTKTQERIDKLLTGEFDTEIQNRVREKAINLTDKNHFQGLQLWLAQYVVYNRHSEADNTDQWKKSHDVQKYLYEFKQHSLRNPIVEQVITETLRTVKDIWEQHAKKNNIPHEMVYDDIKKKNVKSYPKFFNEIHIELGREMKNTADDRKRMTSQISDNENTNQRIKLLLMELKNDTEIEDVRPYSPMQQDILKIYEDGALSKFSEQELKNEAFDEAGKDEAKNVYEVSRKAQPTKNELIRYKLWLQQKYRSPYTGEMIPLSKLFTTDYQIEHIIPQSRYFDDSLSNKVICESAINPRPYKDNQLGLEFIKNQGGIVVDELSTNGKVVKLFTEDEYRKFVDEHYSKNKAKRTKLLLEEIPDKMITRQLNDTRYISKFVSQILSNIVREDKDDDGVNSKNIVPGNGKITTQLKQDWGLNDVWNELVLPRFERMNELAKTTSFTAKNKEGHTIPTIPLELSKGFQKKRIDHRHHAMDALVIACATRSHINFLNNQSAKTEDLKNDEKKKAQIEYRNKLKNSLCFKTKPDDKGNYKWVFNMPWESFTDDTKNELEKIVVSFKQNLRVINKATNHYEKIENGKKIEVEQKGVNWAVRKSLHKAFVFGKVDLPWVNVPKDKTNVAIRRRLSPSIDISKITDTGIQKILKNYLASRENNPELAFSPEGIEDMNKNISQYNNGKFHQPIFKVRTFEVGSRFPLGQKGNKKDKYVETADGTNLFFAVYQRKDTKKRMFDAVPLNEVIEHQKQQVSMNVLKENRTDIPIKKVLEFKNKPVEVEYLFHLSPNDLVYVPTKEELDSNAKIDFGNLTSEQKKRIYKFTDGSGTMANFIPANIATVLFNMNKDKQKKAFGKEMFAIQNEIGVGSQGSKNENAITGEQIKAVCIKLKVDRLGNISKA